MTKGERVARVIGRLVVVLAFAALITGAIWLWNRIIGADVTLWTVFAVSIGFLLARTRDRDRYKIKLHNHEDGERCNGGCHFRIAKWRRMVNG